MKHTGRGGAIAAIALVALVGGGSPLGAQEHAPGGTGPRWRAWVGCWEPVRAHASGPADSASAMRCVIPVDDRTTAEVVTVSDGRIVGRERIVATGERESATREGCTGWERAAWSADGRRLYRRSQYRCEGGLEPRTSELFAMSPRGEWLDIRGMDVGQGARIRVTRYAQAPVPAELSSELVAIREAPGLAVSTARTAAAGPLGTAEVAEASRELDAPVVETWLVERGEGFALDGRRLVELARAGVPDSVIDVMVALSYPSAFTVASVASGTTIGSARPSPQAASTYAEEAAGATIPVYLDPYGYAPYFWDLYYSPFGYAPYGYGYYGWYPGGPPVIIVQPSNGTGQRASHGRVVNGHGYSRTRGSAESGSATTPQPTLRSPAPRSGTSSAPAAGSTSSTKRTAKPRP